MPWTGNTTSTVFTLLRIWAAGCIGALMHVKLRAHGLPNGSDRILIRSEHAHGSFRICALQRQVQGQHIDARLAEDPEAAAGDMLFQQRMDLRRRNAACARYAGDLQGGVGGTDIGDLAEGSSMRAPGEATG
jgi:hypothetical protein